MVEQTDVEALIRRLTSCLEELDATGAHIPAAHVDAAINALTRRHLPPLCPSELD